MAVTPVFTGSVAVRIICVGVAGTTGRSTVFMSGCVDTETGSPMVVCRSFLIKDSNLLFSGSAVLSVTDSVFL